MHTCMFLKNDNAFYITIKTLFVVAGPWERGGMPGRPCVSEVCVVRGYRPTQHYHDSLPGEHQVGVAFKLILIDVIMLPACLSVLNVPLENILLISI